MSDIVERLRQWPNLCPDAEEAADEIERLRAALKPFADAYDAVGEWGPNNTSAARLTQLRTRVMVIDFINARRALEGK